jgi:plastocyanin
MALAVTAVIVGGCGDDSSPTPTASPASVVPGGIPPALRTISITDNKFSPESLQVPAGTGVFWEWKGSNEHSVVGTLNGQKIESPKQRSGKFSFDFTSAGTFEYQCGVHGAAMSGKIVVSS